MRILFIHQNFPGQFRRIANLWSKQPGWDVIGMGRQTAPGMDSIRWIPYELHRPGTKNQHHYLRQMETAVLHGQAVARKLLQLKQQGWVPDAIFAHPGWGETLYAKRHLP